MRRGQGCALVGSRTNLGDSLQKRETSARCGGDVLANCCVDRHHIKQIHHKRWLDKTQYSLARPRDTHSSYNNPPNCRCLPLWLLSFRVPRSDLRQALQLFIG
ncbi:unnamed protein product, partial [Ectocarpus sp. 8 AP-2014]